MEGKFVTLILQASGVYIFIPNIPRPYYGSYERIYIAFLKLHARCDVLQSSEKHRSTYLVAERRNPIAIMFHVYKSISKYDNTVPEEEVDKNWIENDLKEYEKCLTSLRRNEYYLKVWDVTSKNNMFI